MQCMENDPYNSTFGRKLLDLFKESNREIVLPPVGVLNKEL